MLDTVGISGLHTHRCQGDDSDELWTLATYASEGSGLHLHRQTQGLYPERTGLRLSP
jgi:hypothetical protein